MELTTTHLHYPPSFTVPVGLCLVWIFMVLALLKRHGRSAGPVAAALVPLGLFTAAVCAGLVNTMRDMPISGRGGRASTAAGIAQSFGALYAAAFFIVVVAIFSMFRRHRPLVDRVTATFFGVLMVTIAVARVVAATITQRTWQPYAAGTGAIVALAVAAIAAAWTYLAGRGRVVSRPLPYGLAVVLAVVTIVGVVVWQTVGQYKAIAFHG